jgi:phenylacetate-coenzyme A ligase PaaK-like adenylate-forming protein
MSYNTAIRQRAHLYSCQYDDQERLAIQLNLWNNEWFRLLKDVPYYRELSLNLGLPDRFCCWQEFVNCLPITTRSTVQAHKTTMVSNEKPPEFTRMTGGSTAEPVQIPSWYSEHAHTSSDTWLARSWYGISPASRLFLLWGHSHLLGTGLRGWINAQKRMVYDRLLGYYRFSAYDLRPSALQRAARELIRFNPDYMIGYSVALDLFSRANIDLSMELQKIGLKVVMGTAEGFPAPDSQTLLHDLFKCPIGMEYGSVETALIAHTHPAGGYRIFWHTYFVEAERENTNNIGWKVRVTSLYPRCFPLVRYELGDEIELLNSEQKFAIGLDGFRRVIGRCNDYIILSDGAAIHSEVFTHAIRACSAINSFQVMQDSNTLVINYTSSSPLPKEEAVRIHSRLQKIHPELTKAEFKQVQKLQQTIAGKVRMVIRV